jgi:hypothetical protein
VWLQVFSALPEGAEACSISSLAPSNPVLCPKPATAWMHSQSQTGSNLSDPVATPPAPYSQRLRVACCTQSSVSVWKASGNVRAWQVDRSSLQASMTANGNSAGPVVAQWCHEDRHLLTLVVGASRLTCWQVAGVP